MGRGDKVYQWDDRDHPAAIFQVRNLVGNSSQFSQSILVSLTIYMYGIYTKLSTGTPNYPQLVKL